MAGSQIGLQVLMDRLSTISNEYGMKISIRKAKVMKISKGEETIIIIVRIHIGEEEIEQVKEFCYLGRVITTNAYNMPQGN